MGRMSKRAMALTKQRAGVCCDALVVSLTVLLRAAGELIWRTDPAGASKTRLRTQRLKAAVFYSECGAILIADTRGARPLV